MIVSGILHIAINIIITIYKCAHWISQFNAMQCILLVSFNAQTKKKRLYMNKSQNDRQVPASFLFSFPHFADAFLYSPTGATALCVHKVFSPFFSCCVSMKRSTLSENEALLAYADCGQQLNRVILLLFRSILRSRQK